MFRSRIDRSPGRPCPGSNARRLSLPGMAAVKTAALGAARVGVVTAISCLNLLGQLISLSHQPAGYPRLINRRVREASLSVFCAPRVNLVWYLDLSDMSGSTCSNTQPHHGDNVGTHSMGFARSARLTLPKPIYYLGFVASPRFIHK